MAATTAIGRALFSFIFLASALEKWRALRAHGADAALFTRPGDVNAVVEALDRLGDPVERGALEEVARKRALERHGLGRLRQETVAAYG